MSSRLLVRKIPKSIFVKRIFCRAKSWSKANFDGEKIGDKNFGMKKWMRRNFCQRSSGLLPGSVPAPVKLNTTGTEFSLNLTSYSNPDM